MFLYPWQMVLERTLELYNLDWSWRTMGEAMAKTQIGERTNRLKPCGSS